METVVVNIYRDAYDTYIGRRGKGQDGTFGNPYDGPNREENIAKFKTYFYDRLKKDAEFRYKVHQLKGKRLGCFCKPTKSCHGDIIAEYLNNLNETKTTYAIIGSRTFTDYAYMQSILQWFDFKSIVSGGAKGADGLARQYAKEHDIPYKEFLPQWDTFGKSAALKRNEQIVTAAQELIAFWDGVSRGTKHAISLAEKQGKPVYVFWSDKQEEIDLGF